MKYKRFMFSKICLFAGVLILLSPHRPTFAHASEECKTRMKIILLAYGACIPSNLRNPW